MGGLGSLNWLKEVVSSVENAASNNDMSLKMEILVAQSRGVDFRGIAGFSRTRRFPWGPVRRAASQVNRTATKHKSL